MSIFLCCTNHLLIYWLIIIQITNCDGYRSGFSMKLSDFQKSVESTARSAAHKAGLIILQGSGLVNLQGSDITSKIGSRDIVTEYDKKCQEVIKDAIVSQFSDHSFLGEEDVEPGIEASTKACNEVRNRDHVWIVDPIDGTTNFAHGMPLSGVIIGYASQGQILFGCVYDPFRNEMFTAWRGHGAFLNDSPIHCCKTAELKSSVICTGSPPNMDALGGCLRVTNILSPKVRTMRMLGSAAIMFAWVACGRLTAYVETDMNVWDIAAGALIVCEAGGRVTDVWGQDFTLETRNVVASNALIYDQLLTEVQAARMWMASDNEKSLLLLKQ